MQIIKKILQLFLIPAILAGAFFMSSQSRITSDYNFNTDELIYLDRSEYWDAYKSGDFSNPIWQEWGAYDQPQLVNYTYAQIGVDRKLLTNSNSPCETSGDNFHDSWNCLAGKPLSSWPEGTKSLQNLAVRARTLALAISSAVIATTYYLGLLIGGPILGIISTIFLGYYSFFRNLATMAMMDQLLLIFLSLQLIFALTMLKRGKSSLPWHLGLGLVTGLAVSTKFSALPPTLIIYSLLLLKDWRKLIASATLSILVFFGLNPYLWNNPIRRLETMFSWRLTQAENQIVADPSTATTTFVDSAEYSLRETLGTWDHSTTYMIPLLIIGLLGVISLLANKRSRPFGIYSLASILTLLLYLPIKWNRYLLPIMPLLSVTVATGAVALTKYRPRLKHLVLTAIIFATTSILSYLTPLLTLSELVILLITTILTVQGGLVTTAMLYGLTKEESGEPKGIFHELPTLSFSLILPVHNEARVIADTLRAMSKLDYDKSNYEILIPVRADDYETIKVINQTISELDSTNIRTIPVDGDAHTKAYSLNIALHYAQGEIVGVFDAEDEPHRNLLTRLNQEFYSHKEYSAIQAPVQLVNLNSSWYSSLNSLEYYFWFQSVLPFLTKHGITPLGGNTIFLKLSVLKELGGWDESCLTEDADLGIRFATSNYQVGIVTDPRLATLEETPLDELGVIKQRSRWDQGYLQVLAKGNWQSLGSKQKLLALYTLTQPIFRHLAFLNMLIMPVLTSFLHVSTIIALLSFVPAYFLLMQWGMYLLALHDLSSLYEIRVSPLRYFTTFLFFYPYQALLSLATFRALGKLALSDNSWDKTIHYNAHRPTLAETN